LYSLGALTLRILLFHIGLSTEPAGTTPAAGWEADQLISLGDWAHWYHDDILKKLLDQIHTLS
jgi:hypothetical protein